MFLGLGVFSAIKFFKAEATNDVVTWASAFIVCMIGVSMLKIWYWMEMQRNILTREIKRVELQIARLAARIRD